MGGCPRGMCGSGATEARADRPVSVNGGRLLAGWVMLSLVAALGCRASATHAPARVGEVAEQPDPAANPPPPGDPRVAIGTQWLRQPQARGLATSSDGEWLATWDYGELRWHALPSGEPGPRLVLRGASVAMAREVPVVAARTPDGLAVLTAGSAEPTCVAEDMRGDLLGVEARGRFVAVGSEYDGWVAVVDASDCSVVARHEGKDSRLRSVAVVDDDPLTVITARGDDLERWRPAQGEPKTLRSDVGIVVLQPGPGPDQFSSAGQGGVVRIHDVADGRATHAFVIESARYTPRTLCVSPKGMRFAVATHGNDVFVVELGAAAKTPEPAEPLPEPFAISDRATDPAAIRSGRVVWRAEDLGYDTSAVFTADGKHVLTTSWDAAVRRFLAADGTPKPIGPEGPLAPVEHLLLSADADSVFVAQADRVLELSLKTANVVSRTESTPGRITSLALAADGTLAAGLVNGALVRFDADGKVAQVEPWLTAKVAGLAVLPDDRGLAATGGLFTAWGNGDDFRLARGGEYDLTTPSALSVSPDGATILVGDHDGDLHAFDAATGDVVAAGELEYPDRIRAIVYDPTGTRIAVVGSDLDLLSADDLTPLRYVDPWAASVRGAAWSPDGTRIAYVDDEGMIFVLDGTSGQAVAAGSHEGEKYTAVAWLPGDDLLLARHDTSLVLRAVSSLDPEHEDVVASRVPFEGDDPEDDERPVRVYPFEDPTPWRRVPVDCGPALRDAAGRPLPACAKQRLGRTGWQLPDDTEQLELVGDHVWASGDSAVVRVDATTGERVTTIPTAYVGAAGFAVSDDGNTIALSRSRDVQVWDGAKGRLAGIPWTSPRDVDHMALDPRGRRLAVADATGIEIRPTRGDPSAPSRLVLATEAPTEALAFAEDGRALWVANAEGLDLYGVGDGKLRTHVDALPVEGLVFFSRAGGFGLWDELGELVIGDAASQQRTVLAPDLLEIVDVAPAANVVLALGTGPMPDQETQWTTVGAGRVLAQAERVGGPQALSEDGTRLALSVDDVLEIRDTTTLDRIAPQHPSQPNLEAVALDRDEVVAVADGGVIRWSLRGGTKRRIELPGTSWSWAAVSDAGRFAATWELDRLKVVDLKTGALATMRQPMLSVIAVSVDGRRVLARDYADQPRVLVLDVARKKVLLRRGGGPAPDHAAMSDDGRVIALPDVGGVEVIDVATRGTRRIALGDDPETTADSLALGHDGARLIATLSKRAYVVDVQAGKVLRTLGERAPSPDLSDDGSRLAFIDEYGRLQVWPTEGGPGQTFFGLSRHAGSPRFSPGSRTSLVVLDANPAAAAVVFDLSRARP